MDSKTNINNELNIPATQINPSFGGAGGKTVINNDIFESSRIPTGTLLCGKYRVINEMPFAGGEASLFLCEHRNKGYVVKLYRRDIAIKDDVSKVLKMITSPYVAKVYDTGVYNGLPFEIIPYYEKGSLEGRTFSFDELKERIIPSLNEGLHVLHKNGIIHKDLKPSNIMLCDNEQDVVIIDFGISSVKDSSNTVIVTKTGMTPEYSASETFRNLFLEESDYYSLGITLYELFTGRTPYSNMSSEEIEQYVSIQRIPFPSNMPEELCGLIAGLTYNDITYRKNKSNPNRRWTYDEVAKWCNGEYQQIPGEGITSSDDQIPAYNFMKQKYTNVPSLVDALGSNWKEGKKQLFRNILSEFFKRVDPEIAGCCLDASDEQAEGSDPDLLFFRTLYKISPSTRAFYWKGHRYESLNDLGDAMLAKLRVSDLSDTGFYDDILSNRIISLYVSIKDPNNAVLIDAVDNMEKMYEKAAADKSMSLKTFFLVGYMLSGQRNIIVNDKSINNVDELVFYLRNVLKDSVEKFQLVCYELINENGTLNEQFEAWLIAQGKEKELQKWKKLDS